MEDKRVTAEQILAEIGIDVEHMAQKVADAINNAQAGAIIDQAKSKSEKLIIGYLSALSGLSVAPKESKGFRHRASRMQCGTVENRFLEWRAMVVACQNGAKKRGLDVCQRLFGGFSGTTYSTCWNYLEIEVKSLYYWTCGVQEYRL